MVCGDRAHLRRKDSSAAIGKLICVDFSFETVDSRRLEYLLCLFERKRGVLHEHIAKFRKPFDGDLGNHLLFNQAEILRAFRIPRDHVSTQESWNDGQWLCAPELPVDA